MPNLFTKKIFIVIIFFLVIFLLPKLVFAAETSPDAIATRVFPNPDHSSPLAWYQANIKNQGSPQALTVDGYEAVRDGRTVYVNAANISGSNFYTNIYLLSYNQGVEQATEDIFGQLLSHWKFNTNLLAEQKEKVRRDTKRLADLAEMKSALIEYKNKKGDYPSLTAGSYVANKSVSVWPSWQATLGAELGITMPIDPVNKLGSCPQGYDTITCWDQKNKKFINPDGDNNTFDLPANSFAYIYSYSGRESYNICALIETADDYSNIAANSCYIINACASTVLLNTNECGSGVATSANQVRVHDETCNNVCSYKCTGGYTGATCQNPPVYTCNASTLPSSHASACNTLSAVYNNQSYRKVASCGSDECTYECTGGYIGATCQTLPTYTCGGSIPASPSHAQSCNVAATASGQSYNYNETCDTSCSYKCIDSYTGDICQTAPVYSCAGTANTLQQPCGSGAAASPNQVRIHDETCANVCSYKCAGGYTGDTCQTPPTYSCAGTTLPDTIGCGSGAAVSDNQTRVHDETCADVCSYKCDATHHWDGSTCADNTKTVSCTGLPTVGAEWNVNATVFQTWVPAISDWDQLSVGQYDTNQGACKFKCQGTYNWDGVSACVPKCSGVVCTASDQCHEAGVCDPNTGVCSDPIKSGSCDDGISCTKNDTCTAVGTCGGTAYSCAAPGECQASNTCDGAGGCTPTNKIEGTACGIIVDNFYEGSCYGGSCDKTCLNTWRKISGVGGAAGKCLKFYSSLVTYSVAAASCASVSGGRLPSSTELDSLDCNDLKIGSSNESYRVTDMYNGGHDNYSTKQSIPAGCSPSLVHDCSLIVVNQSCQTLINYNFDSTPLHYGCFMDQK